MLHLRDLVGAPWACPCTPPKTWDCWALVVEVRKRMGLETPRYADEASLGLMSRSLIKRPPSGWHRLDGIAPGCVVRMGGEANHVGVAINRVDVIHARHGIGVGVDRLLLMSDCDRVTFWEYVDA